jgi:hypothetical protein
MIQTTTSAYQRMVAEFDKAEFELLNVEWFVRFLHKNREHCEDGSCLDDILLFIATRRNAISEAEDNLTGGTQ